MGKLVTDLEGRCLWGGGWDPRMSLAAALRARWEGLADGHQEAASHSGCAVGEGSGVMRGGTPTL